MRKILLSGLVVIAFLTSGSLIAYAVMENQVTIQFSDDKPTIVCEGLHRTLAEALKDEGQDIRKLKGQYTPSIAWDASLENRSNVQLTRKHNVSLTVGGKQVGNFQTTKRIVGDFLKEQGVQISQWDEMNARLDQKITNNLNLVIDEVKEVVTTETKKIRFQVKEKKDKTLANGEKRVEMKGKDGRKVFMVTTLFKNGKPMLRAGKPVVNRALVEEVKPVNEVVMIGTNESSKDSHPTIGTLVTFKSTCYCERGKTASGTRTRKGVIAVDPRVIPLGTRVYVEGYGWATAEDTGGAIKGRIIDIWKPTEAECYKWGIRPVRIWIDRK